MRPVRLVFVITCIAAAVLYGLELLQPDWKASYLAGSMQVPSQQVWRVNTTTTTLQTSTTTTTTTTTLKTSTTTTTTTNLFYGVIPNSAPFYAVNDSLLFAKWSQKIRYAGNTLPRVLIFTWGTEDTIALFTHEVYWKACYAHAHGFDLVFTHETNLSGVKKFVPGPNDPAPPDSANDRWYTEENMWAWMHSLRKHLYSGDYDYVFFMGADVLILGANLDFPVWAWDRGHDITQMDDHHSQPPFSFGLNENDILFRPTEFTRKFLDEFFEYGKKGFHLQGDNGPYMENLLVFLGYEAEKKGLQGYEQACYEFLNLSAPNAYMTKYFKNVIYEKMMAFDNCFYIHLNRLAGAYGQRQSEHLGFSPTYHSLNGGAPSMPSAFTGDDRPIGPWANCWRNPRFYWPDPTKNCFAYHWSGLKNDPIILRQRSEMYEGMGAIGRCPDPTFDWESSPYNMANRR